MRGGEAQDAAAESIPDERPRAQSVQRVQIGLIGLAAMVLLVGLANVILTSAQQSQSQVVPEAAPTVSARPPAPPVSDPLADMGVVPASSETGRAGQAPAVPPPGAADVPIPMP